MNAKYTPIYIAEFQFRYNNQENEDIFGTAIIGRQDLRGAMLAALLLSTKGKRFLYRQPDEPRTLKQSARALLRWRVKRKPE